MKTLVFLSILITSLAHATHYNILSMQGCYDVSYKFKEVATKEGSTRSAPYASKAKELVVVEKNTQDEIHLQHILITRGGIIKHWRQEWYNATNKAQTLMIHTLPNKWENKTFAQEQDMWIQYVTNTDDAPRYSCAAAWIDNSWICSGLAPLPRREYTKRSDYNMMERSNIVMVTEKGWVHAQENEKLNFSDAGLSDVVGKEVGLNTYTKIDDAQCAEGLAFWEKRRASWLVVQNMWRHIFEEHNPLMMDVLRGDVDLASKLDAIVEESLNESDVEAALKKVKKKAHDVIHEYFL